MAEMEIDPEMGLILLFSYAAMISNGIVQDSIIPFIDIGNVLFTYGNFSLTIAGLISVLSLLVVVFNRDAPIATMDGVIEIWVAYATIALIISPPLLPLFRETLLAGPAGIVAFSVQTLGFALISYKN
jgi:hypothetical protein